MNKSIKKYHRFIFFLYPLYIYFFLLTPFLHYHTEKNSLHPNKITIHSHILNEHDEEHSHHDSEHRLDDCNDHEHVYEINTYKFIKLTKSISLSYVSNLLAFNNVPNEPISEEPNLTFLIDLPNKLLWEKSAQSATNLSPPIA